MPTTSEIHALREVLDELARAAAADISELWRLVDGMEPARAMRELAEAYPEVVTPYSAAAADVAAVWYDDLAPGAPFQAVAAAPAAIEQLQATARWAAGPLFGVGDASPLDLLTGAGQRHIYNGSRDTIRLNAEAEGVRFARYASGTACAFCRLMAIRGAVYRDRRSAENFHDRDRCMAVPDRPDSPIVVPSYVEKWADEYKAARKATDGSTAGILTAMRVNDTK
ncbi:hypothetical protein [Nocardia vulneris]|uniref:VG15 protein n=1 Tax=Nocardia vulneris TaxID=1141657 RepID=UPI000690A7EF|nr:hypothetical protein [Nocardia vulneris]